MFYLCSLVQHLIIPDALFGIKGREGWGQDCGRCMEGREGRVFARGICTCDRGGRPSWDPGSHGVCSTPGCRGRDSRRRWAQPRTRRLLEAEGRVVRGGPGCLAGCFELPDCPAASLAVCSCSSSSAKRQIGRGHGRRLPAGIGIHGRRLPAGTEFFSVPLMENVGSSV